MTRTAMMAVQARGSNLGAKLLGEKPLKRLHGRRLGVVSLLVTASAAANAANAFGGPHLRRATRAASSPLSIS